MCEQRMVIRHALSSGGEYYIKGVGYVDGYCLETNTVYEFHGSFWHGDPRLFKPEGINQVNKKTYGDLYQDTLKRDDRITSMGYKLVVVWESEIDSKYLKTYYPVLVRKYGKKPIRVASQPRVSVIGSDEIKKVTVPPNPGKLTVDIIRGACDSILTTRWKIADNRSSQCPKCDWHLDSTSLSEYWEMEENSKPLHCRQCGIFLCRCGRPFTVEEEERVIIAACQRAKEQLALIVSGNQGVSHTGSKEMEDISAKLADIGITGNAKKEYLQCKKFVDDCYTILSLEDKSRGSSSVKATELRVRYLKWSESQTMAVTIGKTSFYGILDMILGKRIRSGAYKYIGLKPK